MSIGFSVPGLEDDQAEKIRTRLQERLNALIDLGLTLKHIHWNVVGPSFIGVHEMLDPQYEAVQAMVDEVAERIATLGGSPVGTPGNIVSERSWDDYSVGRAMTQEHLSALDLVYTGVNEDHRTAIQEFEDEPISQDMLVAQAGQLEQFQWFVRAHLEDGTGHLLNEGATTEGEAVAKASQQSAQASKKQAQAPAAPAEEASPGKKRTLRKAAAKR
ncbi:MAG: DNA protection during starvation protein [uncultured Acidimicrobiales bacterium]|uniref:DNA protection during starvation protein n=1 Tax=uncultured Acidimicrobiales bacterium TaxID=310071 RepID=A0A6J4HWH6_9ACTN|nr:MAG: DNA protection during starvation protein [uncultured Acidimicrobiales bacterium]